MEKGQYRKKQHIWHSVIISFFFSFTTIFCICIESFFSASTNFWFSVEHFIIPLILLSICIWAIALLLCVVIKNVMPPLFFSVGVCAYLQLNLLNANYGVLDGTVINWDSYGSAGITNAIVWLVIIAGIFVLYRKKSTIKVMTYVSILLVIMQTAGLVSQSVSSIKQQDEPVLTVSGINAIGEKENLVLIVVDSLDERHIEYLLDTNDILLKELDGFTYYGNAVSPYPKTATSLPYMLTGIPYKNEIKYDDFLTEALSQSDLLNHLNASNYDVGIYTDVNMPLSVLGDKVANVGIVEQVASSQWGLLKELMRYALFREVPHALKCYFPIAVNDFNRFHSGTESGAYVSDDVAYYTALLQEGLTVNKGESSFRLIHLVGTHEPFTLSEDVTKIEKSNAIAQLKGCMKIVSTYLQELKRQEVYDETAIMILGDHGAILGNQPALLFKSMGSRGPLKVSDAAIEYGDIHQTLLQEIDAEASHGMSIPLIGTTSRKRMNYDYKIHDQAEEGFFPVMWEAYYLDDNAHPHFSGKVYYAGKEYSYSDVAESITLNQMIGQEQMRPYFNSNFLSWGSSEYIFVTGLEGVMLFKLPNVPRNGVLLELNFIEWIDSSSKPLKVSTMDGIVLFEGEYVPGNESVFRIPVPAKCFDDTGAIALRMEWKSDTGQLTENNHDLRRKQVGLKHFTIIEQSESDD